jgi:hypothetical protein
MEPFLVYETPPSVRARALECSITCAYYGECSIDSVMAKASTAVVRLRTNQFPQSDPSEGAKAFARGLLTIRTKWRVQCPSGPYGVLHARVGDDMLAAQGDLPEIPEYVYHMVAKASASSSVPWMFMSDSSTLLPLVKEAFPSITLVGNDMDERFTAPPGHIGVQEDPERIATTIRDIQLVCGASEIVSCTCYTWVSGFVVWLSTIFNIPLRSAQDTPINPTYGCTQPLQSLRGDFAPHPRVGTGKGRTFVTFCAGSVNYHGAGLELCKQARQSGLFARVVCYTELDLQADVAFWQRFGTFINANARGFGYWLWKPYVIGKELAGMADDAVLLYLDAGCRIDPAHRASLRGQFERLTLTPLLCAPPCQSIGQWTKRDLLALFNADMRVVHDRPMYQAGVLVMRKCPAVLACMADWWQVCSQYLHLLDDTPSRGGEHVFYKENRHDQSVLNLCLLRHGLQDNVVPCCMSKEDKREAILYVRKRYAGKTPL